MFITKKPQKDFRNDILGQIIENKV